MIDKEKNQNDLIGNVHSELFDLNFNFDNHPLNRVITKPTVEDKLELLNILKESIKKIENCDLKNNAKNLVFGDGNTNSKIMIIGEGPGQKEDLEGKPFVGDAGKLLDKMLNAINLKRNQTYITNVVNYRPPDNRKPEQSEIIKYSKFLKQHINIINPKILVLMGSTAMEALIGKNLKITQERGKWREISIYDKSYLTMITFHPAYLLRQPDKKKYSWEDLKEIKKKLQV